MTTAGFMMWMTLVPTVSFILAFFHTGRRRPPLRGTPGPKGSVYLHLCGFHIPLVNRGKS